MGTMTKKKNKNILRIRMKDGTEYVVVFPSKEAIAEANRILDYQIRTKKGMMYV